MAGNEGNRLIPRKLVKVSLEVGKFLPKRLNISRGPGAGRSDPKEN
jgi:hypothetical protein